MMGFKHQESMTKGVGLIMACTVIKALFRS